MGFSRASKDLLMGIKDTPRIIKNRGAFQEAWEKDSRQGKAGVRESIWATAKRHPEIGRKTGGGGNW